MHDLKNEIVKIRSAFSERIEKTDSPEAFESIRIEFLGRKGRINSLFKIIGGLDAEARRHAGGLLNELKNDIQKVIDTKKSQAAAGVRQEPSVDYSLPGDRFPVGRYHPLTQVLREIKSCFLELGFSIAQGPEVEKEYYNFEALNIPKGHPARDMQDTLFVGNETVLRTHTSPVQVRVMEQQGPPVRIIAPGRCFRRDTPDSTHSPIFHQIEGLCVDEGITFADLKGVILHFARYMFGSDMKIRFRPSFFPFTEPSAEYDFSCHVCRGKGCRVCKETGWIEISGAGMVNPRVFQYVDYDSERYTGYAFGMGLERIAMLKYEFHDIRLFYENDVRMLQQF